jgi:DNA-binding MarR family transcriptional regulator
MSSTGKALFSLGPDSDLPPPVRAFRTVLVLAQTLRYLMDDRLRADGLTTQQAALLTVVHGLGRPSLREAASAMGTTHQNAAQLVGALQRKDLLRAEPDPADKRRVRLTTTSANEAYWRERNEDDFAAVAQWFAVLSDEEIEAFGTLASRVVDGLDAHRQAARLRR